VGKDVVMRAISIRLFIEHPASVGETYAEHARHAASFGVSMLLGAIACFLHALVPALCTTTASRLIARLHSSMIINRSRFPPSGWSTQPPPDFLAEHI
jgi:hypothetical protein